MKAAISLNSAEIGPNAHQPRTIFDEDELNELAASIKRSGCIATIVVRRRPSEQAEAKQAQHSKQSSTNPFTGHLDSSMS